MLSAAIGRCEEGVTTHDHVLSPPVTAPEQRDYSSVPQGLSFIARYRFSSRHRHSRPLLEMILNAGEEYRDGL